MAYRLQMTTDEEIEYTLHLCMYSMHDEIFYIGVSAAYSAVFFNLSAHEHVNHTKALHAQMH